MLHLVAVLIVCSFWSAVEAGKGAELLFCNDDHHTNLTPSLLEILHSAFTTGGSDAAKAFEALLHQHEDMIPSFANVGVPAAQWFADGVFTFNFSAYPQLSKHIVEVNLLQQDEQFSVTRLPFCLLGWSTWCSCAAQADEVSPTVQANFDHTTPCRTSISRSIQQLHIDPSRPSCVQVVLQPGVDAAEWYGSSAVSYQIDIPTLDTDIVRLLVQRLFPDELGIVSDFLLRALNHIPLYLASMAFGLVLTYFAQEIAEERSFQLLLQVSLGIFAALVVLGFVAHRTINAIFARMAPSVYAPRLVDSFFSFSLFSLGYTYRHYLAKEAIVRLFAFWDEGAFGIWWLGRAYFAVCVLSSFSLCHFFDLFRDPDSRSFVVTFFSCRLIGIVFLLHASSNSAVAWSITLCVLLSVPLQSYFHFYFYALRGAQQARHRHAVVGDVEVNSGRGIYASPVRSASRVSRGEMEVLVRQHTAKHLENLRLHLRDQPAELARYEQTLRVDGREDSARLLQQFAANLYSGKPRPPTTDEEKGTWAKRLRYLFQSIPGLIMVLAVVAVFCLRTDSLTQFLQRSAGDEQSLEQETTL